MIMTEFSVVQLSVSILSKKWKIRSFFFQVERIVNDIRWHSPIILHSHRLSSCFSTFWTMKKNFWTCSKHSPTMLQKLGEFERIFNSFTFVQHSLIQTTAKRQSTDMSVNIRQQSFPILSSKRKLGGYFFLSILWNSFLDLVHDRQFVHIRELSVTWENYRLYKRIVCHIERLVCHNDRIPNDMSFTWKNWEQQKF